MKATLQKEQPKAERRQSNNFVVPEVNIYESNEGYLLEAEMPGVGKDGLEITLDGNEVVIVGRRNPEGTVGEALFRERRPADYRRVFELDPAIDTAKISARMKQGILYLTLPKSEKVKPRKIAVSD